MRERQQELLRDYDVKWIDELPQGMTGCIFSNEFFDALPVHRIVRRDGALERNLCDRRFRRDRRRASESQSTRRLLKARSPISI